MTKERAIIFEPQVTVRRMVPAGFRVRNDEPVVIADQYPLRTPEQLAARQRPLKIRELERDRVDRSLQPKPKKGRKKP